MSDTTNSSHVQDSEESNSLSSAPTSSVRKNTQVEKPTNDVTRSFENMKISPNAREEKKFGSDKITIQANGITYVTEKVVGNGSFGLVFQAKVAGTNESVAIKKVLQDKRFKNRELQIMKMLKHPNIVLLKNNFYTNGDHSKSDEVYLNLVLEYVPETVYRVSRNYSKLKQPIPLMLVKIYTYQLARALAYIHSLGICHRDIKPQNLLLDPGTGILKLCDFGSAKMLVKGEPNVSYICSRYYRAPELIFGSTTYTTAIDIWSMGCVMAELLLGQPLFPGESGVDQLVEIIKVLGTPTREQVQAMNQNYTEFKFPQIKPHPWEKVFRANTNKEALDLLASLLQYSPPERKEPEEACKHAFFDDLRSPTASLPNGRALPFLELISTQKPTSDTTTTTTTTTSPSSDTTPAPSNPPQE